MLKDCVEIKTDNKLCHYLFLDDKINVFENYVLHSMRHNIVIYEFLDFLLKIHINKLTYHLKNGINNVPKIKLIISYLSLQGLA